jgi:hypothetical protein
MGGDIHDKHDPITSINCDNDDDIIVPNVMNNQDGNVDNSLKNEEAQNKNAGLENSNPKLSRIVERIRRII